MRHRTPIARFAVAALTVLALLQPGAALAQQEPPKDTVSFKFTVSGTADVFMIPVEPPMLRHA